MKLSLRLLWLLPAGLALANCSAPRQSPQLLSEIGQLNRKLDSLSTQAVALEQQNALNKTSTSGVYLLPTAQNNAILQSAIGQLSVSLTHLEAEANGAQAVLHLSTLDGASLPGFTAQLDWGQLDAISGKPLTGDMQTQSLSVASTLLPKTQVDIPLRLSGWLPEHIGFVRLQHIEAQTASMPETASAR